MMAAVTADKVVVELELKDGQYLAKVRRNEEQFTKSQRNSARAAEDAERRIRASSAGISTALKSLAGPLAAAMSVGAITKMADSWTDYTSRVKNAIGETGDAADVMERLSQVADRTYSSFSLTAESFLGNAATLKELGYNTNQALDYTEALNNALVVSGAKAERAEQVQNALNRAMAAGRLQGTNLETVIQNGGRVTELLAKELGVTTLQLRKLGKEGKITTNVLFNSMSKNMELVRREAEAMPATISDSFTRMTNALTKYIGETDKALGASERAAAGIIRMSENIDKIAPALGAVAAVFVTKWAAGMVAASVAQDGFVRKGWVATRETIAQEREKTAAVAAGARARALAINAEVVALRRQVDTGRNAAGQYISTAAAQRQLDAANKSLVGAFGQATAATIRNNGAVTAASAGIKALGGGLLAFAGGPVGATVMALVALAAAIKYANDNFSNYARASKAVEEQDRKTSEAIKAYQEAAYNAAKASKENAEEAKKAAQAKRELALREIDAAKAAQNTALAYAEQAAQLARLAAQEAKNPRRGLTEGEAIGQFAYAGGTAKEAERAAELAEQAVENYKKQLSGFQDLERRISDGSLLGTPINITPDAKKDRTAERLAKQAEERRRKAEDVRAEEAMAIARARNNVDEIRSLERAEEIRRRQRTLIDGSTDKIITAGTVQRALTESTKVQNRIDEARLDLQKRLTDEKQLELDIANATTSGELDSLRVLQRRKDLAELIQSFQALEYNEAEATAKANKAMLEIDEARAKAAQERVRALQEEDALTILGMNRNTRENRRAISEAADRRSIEERTKAYQSVSGGGYDEAEARRRAEAEVKALRSASVTKEQRESADYMANEFVSILRSGDIGKAMGDRFREAAFDNLQQMFSVIFQSLMPNNIVGLAGAFGGNRASGGNVRAGMSYNVGERGTEKFVPSQNGYIIPNMKNASAAPGLSGMVKIVVGEGEMFSARVTEIAGPLSVQSGATAATYSQEQMIQSQKRSGQRIL